MKQIILLTVFATLACSRQLTGCHCPQYFAAQGICATDGNIYTDECYAKCHDPELKTLFKCATPFTDKNKQACDEKCKNATSEDSESDSQCEKPAPQPSCESKCPIYIKFNLICASNGKTYMDLCRAHCLDKSLTELFNCSLMNPGECETKCIAAVECNQCKDKCPVYKRRNRICASDGKLYVDECQAQCENSSLAEVFNCGKLTDGECRKQCGPKAELFRCKEACPKLRRRLMYFCFNDGQVYDDECHATCVNRHNKLLFNCEDRGIFTDNKPECDELCLKETTCQRKCKGAMKKWICGCDGELYENKCEAECAGHDVLYNVKEKNEHEVKRCKNRSVLVGSARS